MTADDAAAAIVARLGELADPVRADREARYLKSTREHLGVGVPDVRRTVRTATREHGIRAREDVIAVVTALWPVRPDGVAEERSQWPPGCAGDPSPRPTGEVHERCLAAVETLVAHARVLAVPDLDLVEDLLRRARTWALVDPLAEKVAGDVAAREPDAAAVLDRWAADPDFWLRRSALLALLPPLKAGGGDWVRFTRYADAMLDERPGAAAGGACGAGGVGRAQFFVRKAIGWVLRETGKRRPGLVAGWLAERGDRVPALVRREATKYLGDRPAAGAPRPG